MCARLLWTRLYTDEPSLKTVSFEYFMWCQDLCITYCRLQFNQIYSSGDISHRNSESDKAATFALGNYT